MVRGILGAALAAALALPVAAQTLGGRAEVVDGDTLRIAGETVRLHAIDAPEAGQSCRGRSGLEWPCGQAATDALARLAGAPLRCEGRNRDRYGRLVAKCFAGGEDIGAALVRSGAAFAYPRYGRDYVDAEKEALFAERGVWQGGAVRPEVFRAMADPGVAAAPAGGTAPPEGCRIKGNISGNGRIYHLPGQMHYAETRIDPGRGERWFCSEREARAAGWRRARR